MEMVFLVRHTMAQLQGFGLMTFGRYKDDGRKRIFIKWKNYRKSNLITFGAR